MTPAITSIEKSRPTSMTTPPLADRRRGTTPVAPAKMLLEAPAGLA
jgi:hypothetical protein